MKVHRDPTGAYVVSLARGDDLRSSLESLAAEEQIPGAKVSAIGALEDPELGCYDLPSKTYDHRTFPGIYELVSLSGNLTLLEGKPFLHAHVAISGHDYAVYGGHLFDSKIGVVAEVFVEPVDTPRRGSPAPTSAWRGGSPGARRADPAPRRPGSGRVPPCRIRRAGPLAARRASAERGRRRGGGGPSGTPCMGKSFTCAWSTPMPSAMRPVRLVPRVRSSRSATCLAASSRDR